MKKFLILAVAAKTKPAATEQRRIELLEQAVVKLIKNQNELKNEVESVKNASKINTQMIFQNKKAIENNKITNNAKPKQTFHFYAEVVSFGLNVRKQPTTKSPVVDKLTKGDKALILDTTSDKQGSLWYEISNGITKGFISAAFTRLYVFKGDKAPFIIKRNKPGIKKTEKPKQKKNEKKDTKTAEKKQKKPVIKLVSNKKPEIIKKENEK